MANSVEIRSYGRVFNEIADEYDRHRPAYPDALIDRACEVAGLAPGARVLEIGCGTGQLTRSLLARGLRVIAVEPGERLIARARDQLQAPVRCSSSTRAWRRRRCRARTTERCSQRQRSTG
ncbi:MAG: methyltransferase domain-containing protein [Solirubrobacteraceae bacterium]